MLAGGTPTPPSERYGYNDGNAAPGRRMRACPCRCLTRLALI